MAASGFRRLFLDLEQTLHAPQTFLVGPTPLNYHDFFNSVRRVSHFMQTEALPPGERVVLATEDDAKFTIAALAAMLCGITVVPANPRATSSEVAGLTEAADARALIADAAFQEHVNRLDQSTAPVLRVVTSENAVEARTVNGSATWEEIAIEGDAYEGRWTEVEDDQTAFIMFTSGTTSRPKGVELTYRNLFVHCGTITRQYELDDASHIVNFIPFHHVDGFIQGPLIAIMCGGSIGRGPNITVETLPVMMEAVIQQPTTHLITIPNVLAFIAAYSDFYSEHFKKGRFKFIVSTAAALDENLWRSIERTFGTRIVNVYGLTETTCESFFCGPDEYTRKVGTIGRPVDCEARIVDENGQDVPRGEIGELILKGDHIMKGYFRSPEETAKVLKKGWLHTGDLAVADVDGFFDIVGRIRNMVKVQGEAVFPEAATAVIRQLPEVMDAASFGISDPKRGEVLVACVILKRGRQLNEKQIREHCAQQLSPLKVPSIVRIMEDFPRGPAGKVLLGELRERLTK